VQNQKQSASSSGNICLDHVPWVAEVGTIGRPADFSRALKG
jgi:hypothetical protein